MTFFSAPSRRMLMLECTLLFALLPLFLALSKPRGLLYLALWLLVFYCMYALWRGGSYRFRNDWNAGALTVANIKPLLARFVPFAALLTVFVLAVIPGEIFSLPRRSLGLWAMVMVLYPVLSVFPQEIIFRSFFLERYASLFAGRRSMLVANALAFGWAHIVLLNVVAVSFSAVGGALFADTYRKHRSLALCCFEHALYGCFIFSLGLGRFFYHGAAVH